MGVSFFNKGWPMRPSAAQAIGVSSAALPDGDPSYFASCAAEPI
jgi:hypothetical protein